MLIYLIDSKNFEPFRNTIQSLGNLEMLITAWSGSNSFREYIPYCFFQSFEFSVFQSKWHVTLVQIPESLHHLETSIDIKIFMFDLITSLTFIESYWDPFISAFYYLGSKILLLMTYRSEEGSLKIRLRL